MVTLGGDCHKRTHTLVAVDDNGQQLGAKVVPAVSAGHLEALDWARQWAERRWALENCRHLSRRLEADLLLAGEVVVQVSPKLMAGARRSAREWGKSDPIDALAVARAALRESDLPVAQLEGKAARSSSYSTTATTWLASEPEFKTDLDGSCTSWTRI